MDDNRYSAEETAGERPAPQEETKYKKATTLKELLEQFYGRKFSDPTPEKGDRILRSLKCWQTECYKTHPEFLKEHPECLANAPELWYLLEDTEPGETSSPTED